MSKLYDQETKSNTAPHLKWYPENPPIYDIHKTYLENLHEGPFFQGAVPKRHLPPKEKWLDFLGHKIASPLGVPAGPLLSSSWIKLAADLGFDVLTYKTIRSKAHPAHPLPNMVYVEPQNLGENEQPVQRTDVPPLNIEHLSVTNSFGMPSMSQEFLGEDIEKANRSLKEGQVMIVSVVGTPDIGVDFIEDYVNAACFAKDSGAKIIEANFSCPNIDRAGGSLYLSPSSVFTLAERIVKAIHPIPLIIKVGAFPNEALQSEVMRAAARAGVQAIEGLNTIKRKVVDRMGNPGLDEDRLYSGLCGGMIRQKALSFVERAGRINAKEKLDLAILGVGGITLPKHFDLFLARGAKIALTATGMMWDPYLAAKWHQKK